MKRRLKNAAGFTLVELIVVIAILGILAGVAVPTYSGYVKKANEAADNQLLMAVNTAFASACIEQGMGDTKNLSVRPQATIDDAGAVTLNNYYNDGFQRYFAGSGVFKYYDILGFDAEKGLFIGNSVAELMKLLKESWDGSSYDDGTGVVMTDLLETFDMASVLFQNGMTLEAIFSDAPADLANALKLGTFNELTEEEMEDYLRAKNIPENQWDDYKKIMQANAHVLNFANAAPGGNAATIKADVEKFMELMKVSGSGFTEEDAIKYYNNTPEGKKNRAENYEDVLKAYGMVTDKEDPLYQFNIMKIAMAKAAGDRPDLQNSSGINTLGSIYAVAAGFFHNDKYYQGDVPELAYFQDAFMVAMTAHEEAFTKYLNEQGQKDIEAYLNAMSYLSTSDVDLTSSNAFYGQYGFLADALGLPKQTQ